MQAAGEQLQVIFLADADRAMDGMRDGRDLPCGEAGAVLGDCGVGKLDFEMIEIG